MQALPMALAVLDPELEIVVLNRAAIDREGTMKTLIVDDSSTIRRIVRSTLETRFECRVWECESGEEAQALLTTEGPFALVVTDLHMMGGGGESLIRALRARPDGAGTAVLIMSVEPTNGTGVEGLLRAGADGFLSKPFHLDDLEAAVRQVLQRSAPPTVPR